MLITEKVSGVLRVPSKLRKSVELGEPLLPHASRPWQCLDEQSLSLRPHLHPGSRARQQRHEQRNDCPGGCSTGGRLGVISNEEVSQVAPKTASTWRCDPPRPAACTGHQE